MFQKESINVKTLSVIVAFLSLAILFPSTSFARSKEFEINCPYWDIDFDRAGYVDITNWYQSERHSHGPHEMMTGDWAAAVWYNGINDGNDHAQWLTDEFIIPDFDTTQIFDFSQPSSQAYYVENDPCNPVWEDDPCQPSPPPYNPSGKYDSGWSKIDDDKLQVKIHYEVVDLGENDGSPLAFRDANDNPTYVLSERYVLLQTYVFENIHATEHIYDLEFYQMMHGHPANAYSDLVGCYETASYSDPLSSYTPYDSNHTVGNFHYDITMWNDYTGDPNSQHVDWMSFSSTVSPDDVDLNEFEDEVSDMRDDIENRALNGRTSWENDDMAGAMKWYLDDDLSPGETTSITLALMYGTAWEAAQAVPVKLRKEADVEYCVKPYNEDPDMGVINYTIDYNMAEWSDPCVYIVDELPDEVDEPNFISDDGVYDGNEHTVTWQLGDLEPNETGSIELTVHVNNQAEPGGTIVNNATMYGDTFTKSASVTTCVDCWAGDIIFVDDDADPNGDGRSWETAFNDLQEAIDEVGRDDCLTTIWVAAGEYKPVADTNVTNWADYSFELADGVALIGHFAGTEDYPSERDLSNSANETVLQAEIEPGDNVGEAVKAIGAKNCLLDGFSINDAANYGIEITGDANVAIANCTFKKCDDSGIRMEDTSSAQLHNCTFFNNDSGEGIGLENFSAVYLTDCIFDGNDNPGSRGIKAIHDSIISAMNCSFTNHDYGAVNSSGETVNLTDCNISESTGNGYCSVDMYSVTTSVIKGCFIENTGGRGIEALSCQSLTVEYTEIMNCGNRGIDFTGSGTLTVRKSSVCNSENNEGIFTSGSALLLEESLIYGNDEYGVQIRDGISSPVIKNCWIYENGDGGMYLYGPDSEHIIRNNTIYDNQTYGIKLNSGADPNIINCIIWNNGDDLLNCSATYSCIEDSFDANDPNFVGSINSDPCFYDSEANDYHITAESPCKDTGTGDYNNETDIDGEPRTADANTDMGADEYYWSPADFDEDGTVNFIDYSILAAAWQNESGEGNYNEDCDLEDNNSIDVNDLALFCEDWLWKKAWGTGYLPLRMGGGGFGFSGDTFMSASVSPVARDGGLMISDISESINAMPDSLYAKTEKFYAVNAFNSVSALQKAEQAKKETIKEVDIEELIKWLDELWESDEIQDSMTYDEYIEFREAIKSSAEYDY